MYLLLSDFCDRLSFFSPDSVESASPDRLAKFEGKVKVKFSHTRYRALGPELIPVYRQSARR